MNPSASPMEILADNISRGGGDAASTKYDEGSIPTYADNVNRKPRVHGIRRQGSLEIASRLLKAGIRPCVLSFANNNTPGGPTGLKGSTQEEVLMKRTTLGASLQSAPYPIDDVEDLMVRWNYKRLSLIYTPHVHIVRSQANEPIDIDPEIDFAMISCAAICAPRTRGGRYEAAADRDVTRRKIGLMLDVAIHNGHTVFIAGEWGCGAFLNPKPEVCEIWFSETQKRPISVVFPVFSSEFDAELQRQAVEYSRATKP